MSPTPTESESAPQSRDLAIHVAGRYPEHVNRWALVVGISKYQDPDIKDLDYAHRDAEALCALLRTPSGGHFNHILSLTDEEATTSAITRALRSWLKQPAREDIVVIYVSCHGAPDPQRPGNLYLITHDTEFKDISGTAVRMSEIDQVLRDTLHAERVVIIADTCHSGGFGGRMGTKSLGAGAAAVNTYLHEVSQSKPGVALLTSSEANELSLEHQRWGNGHGVFTYFLLQGMQGGADGYGQPKDGKVTVGELFDYVKDNVKGATANQQHPYSNADFDRGLTMAVTGGINAREHAALGHQLMALGWLLDDPSRFASAARQFDEALSQAQTSGETFPEAELALGLAQEALGDLTPAVQRLRRMVKAAPEQAATAQLHLAIALSRQQAYSEAAAALQRFVERAPTDPRSPWASRYIDTLQSGPIGKKYALLIGIDTYAYPSLSPLRGCLNDVTLLRQALAEKLGFADQEIRCLRNQEATRAGILQALQLLIAQTRPADTVLVHYSGHSLDEPYRTPDDGDAFLLVHDTDYSVDSASGATRIQNAVRAPELHTAMLQLPSANKILLLDTHGNTAFTDLATRQRAYTVLLASYPGKQSHEHAFQAGDQLLTAGLFSGVLAGVLASPNAASLTYGALLEAIQLRVRELGYDQEPMFIGNSALPVFSDEDAYLALFDFARRRSYAAFSRTDLKARELRWQQQGVPWFPAAYASLGRAYSACGDPDSAVVSLQGGLQTDDGSQADLRFALAAAYLHARRYAEALAQLDRYAAQIQTASAALPAQLQELRATLDALKAPRRHALVIGIDRYAAGEIPQPRGAANDAALVQALLLERLDFAPTDLVVLRNEEATRSQILSAFQTLVHHAASEPALFYFAGCGSVAADGALTLVSADGRQEGIYDIELRELAGLVDGAPTNLVTIVDAGWTAWGGADADAAESRRTAPRDKRERPVAKAVGLARQADELRQQRIGAITIYPSSISMISASQPLPAEGTVEPVAGAPQSELHGLLTYALVKRIWQEPEVPTSYRRWVEQMAELGPILLGDLDEEPIFAAHTRHRQALELVRQLEQQPLQDAILTLARLVEERERRREIFPDGYLNLGIAYAAVGNTDQAITHLEQALEQGASGPFPEIHYHLGRVLYTAGRQLGKAVDQLQLATQRRPDDGRAYYYLGQAIRALVERETLQKARQAFSSYLAKGAPMGHADEVREFLSTRAEVGKADTSIL